MLIVAIPLAVAVLVLAVKNVLQQRAQMMHLKEIGLAFRWLDEAYGRLPPAVRLDEQGKPLSSWRFQICPFLESFMQGVDYDKPWNDPENRTAMVAFAPFFCGQQNESSPTRFHTRFMVVTGPGTPFDGQRVCRLADLDDDTVLVVKVISSGVHWMEPGDLSIDQLPASLAQGPGGDGLCVLFADGAVWLLDKDTPIEKLKPFFTIEGAKQNDRQTLLGPYVRASEPAT